MMYMISENEMRSLSNYNHLVSFFWSVAVGACSFAGGLAIQTAQQENATPEAWTLVKVVGGVCGVIAVGALIAALLIYLARKGAVERIQSETRALE